MRTAMNMGVGSIHYVHKYENIVINSLSSGNKTDSGTMKWLDVKS
jgi:hypothetical protein